MKKFIFVPFLLFVVSVFAQKEKVDTVLNLQEVIVTGSRAERPLTQSPGRIDVITPLVLRHSPA